MRIEIEGAEKLALIGQSLKKLSVDGSIARDMGREIRAGVPPIRAAVRANAGRLPSSGGLAARIARSKVTASVRTSRSSAGVTIKTSAGSRSNTVGIDAGTVRHPVFNTGAWVGQSVPPGYVSDAYDGEAPKILERAATAALDKAIARIAHGA